MPKQAILDACKLTHQQWKELTDKERRQATEYGNKVIADSHPKVSITYSQTSTPAPAPPAPAPEPAPWTPPDNGGA